MRRLLTVLVLALPLSTAAETKVTLLHFSDYHSHAVPFYSEDGERGGIARAIGYLRSEKRAGALVFNGGDTINKGAPAWSDRYGCAEWPWLNGIVDAMAFGNHEADYGMEYLARCQRSIRYPILSANVGEMQRFAVFESRGIRIGVFAVAGSDFSRLVTAPGLSFGDPVEAARAVVHDLRENQRVDAVIMIGHQHSEADYALAKAVPGIDLIFGTHSHLKRELTRIPGTDTWFISPFQYLTYISRVELTFEGGDLSGVRGELVPVDKRMREHRGIARRVRTMQTALERDPRYRDLFMPIAVLPAAILVKDLAGWTLEAMRDAAGADVALSTTSSFRRPLPAGELTMESLRGALPYDNEIVVCTMTGSQLQRLLDESAARRVKDSGSYVLAPAVIDPAGSYRVATTEYQANVAYREFFDCVLTNTGLRVREELRRRLVREAR
ncbi:MAG TPA: 5'-nucleotidase C-terminal domain-containing protein [Thermoanaerobaculia bacterium]